MTLSKFAGCLPEGYGYVVLVGCVGNTFLNMWLAINVGRARKRLDVQVRRICVYVCVCVCGGGWGGCMCACVCTHVDVCMLIKLNCYVVLYDNRYIMCVKNS